MYFADQFPAILTQQCCVTVCLLACRSLSSTWRRLFWKLLVAASAPTDDFNNSVTGFGLFGHDFFHQARCKQCPGIAIRNASENASTRHRLRICVKQVQSVMYITTQHAHFRTFPTNTKMNHLTPYEALSEFRMQLAHGISVTHYQHSYLAGTSVFDD